MDSFCEAYRQLAERDYIDISIDDAKELIEYFPLLVANAIKHLAVKHAPKCYICKNNEGEKKLENVLVGKSLRKICNECEDFWSEFTKKQKRIRQCI